MTALDLNDVSRRGAPLSEHTTGWRRRFHSAVWEHESTGSGAVVLRTRAVYPILAVVVLILGMNWPFMSIGLRSISALWMVAFRLIGARFTAAL